jgi:hypothetical protein
MEREQEMAGQEEPRFDTGTFTRQPFEVRFGVLI